MVGNRTERFCQVNISPHLRGALVLAPQSMSVRQQQESVASVAKGYRLKYASRPPAHARANEVAQGDGFQHKILLQVDRLVAQGDDREASSALP